MSKITESARGKQCTVRIPGVCNGDPATTVAAHLNGGGTGTKKSDLQVAFACSACHAAIDKRVRHSEYASTTLELFHRQGVERTQEMLLEAGLIVIVGE